MRVAAPAVARCTHKLLSFSSFPKPKFLSAAACLLRSDPPDAPRLDSPASSFAAAGASAVLRGFCAEMKLEEAERVLVNMEEHGIVPDVYCFGALIHGHCKSSNLPRALALHDYMLSKGVRSNCVIISTLLQCFCDMGMPHEAVHQFNEFRRSGIFLDEITYNIAIDALCKLGRVEAAAQLLEEMKGKRMIVDFVHCTALLSGYRLQCDIRNALGVLEQMEEGRSLFSSHSIFKERRSALALGICNLILETEAAGIQVKKGGEGEVVAVLLKLVHCSGDGSGRVGRGGGEEVGFEEGGGEELLGGTEELRFLLRRRNPTPIYH